MITKKRIPIITACVLGVVLGCSVLFIAASRYGNLSFLLPVKHQAVFIDKKVAQFPLMLTVRANQIIDEDGKTVILKGVMPPDPTVSNKRGNFNRAFYAGIQETNANVIRIPVHPEEWIKDEDYLWRYLSPIVSWAGELNMYVIIDWHYIGNVATGAGSQMPNINIAPKELTMEFWRLIATYFRDAPNVIFEVFNEPESIGAEEWRSNATEIVQVIRDQKAEQIIIVGGLDFGRDLSWVIENPINAKNIAYATHIYPIHSSDMWQYWFGDVAEKYPVLITEWGFMDENRDAAPDYLIGSELTYGHPFTEYLNAREIGWVGCWYDDEWLPNMFTENGKGTTYNGNFILGELNNGSTNED